MPHPGSWPATGMAGSDTLDVGFSGIAADPVGPPGGYTSRPGFSHGGVGVAACWYGGARGIGQALAAAAAKRDVGPHALAHLGAVDIALRTVRPRSARRPKRSTPTRSTCAARPAAGAAGPGADRGGRQRRDGTRTVGRWAPGRSATMRRTPARVADLTVYLRQHHAERDLAQLGELVAGHGATGERDRPACTPSTRRAPTSGPGAAWPRLGHACRVRPGPRGLARVQRRDRRRPPGRRGARRRRADVHAGRRARPAAAGGGHRRGRLPPRTCHPGRARAAPDGRDGRRAARPGRPGAPR